MLVLNRQHPLARGLVAWWRPSQQWVSGTLWRDLVQGYPATLTNMAYPASTTSGWSRLPYPGARQGGYMSFDGSNDYVTCGVNAAFTPQRLSVAYWLRLRTAGAVFDGFFGSTNSASWTAGYGAAFDVASKHRFWVQDYTLNFSQSTSVLSTGVNNFIVGTYDGANIRSWMNGEAGSVDTYTGAVGTGNPLELGRTFRDAENLAGDIGDFMLWNRGLSAGEAQSLYVLARQGFVGLLHMPSDLAVPGVVIPPTPGDLRSLTEWLPANVHRYQGFEAPPPTLIGDLRSLVGRHPVDVMTYRGIPGTPPVAGRRLEWRGAYGIWHRSYRRT